VTNRYSLDAPGAAMPHIQFDINKTLGDTDKIGLAQQVRQLFADIRAGRSIEQRRSLCLGLMDLVNQRLGIPQANMYITLTEHKGEDFHLHEKYLPCSA
jgi:hypothetical protein